MIKKKKLEKLREFKSDNCASIYIPTEVTGDYEKNRIRWKNACNDILKQLEERNVEKTSFMKPALDLIDDKEFWAHQSAGLAGFYSEEEQGHYHLLSVSDTVAVVDDKFHLSPILREVINEDRVFILSLSQNEVKFYEAVNSGIFPVRIYDVVPRNMDEALNLVIDGNQLQTHSAGGNAIFHGNDSGEDKENMRLKQYFRKVDDGLMEFIHDEKVPLVLACVEEYYSMYKEITDYKHFSPHMITGNPEQLTPAELRAQIEPLFKELKDKRLNKFVNTYNLKADVDLTVDGLASIAELSEKGNIESMLLCQNHWNDMNRKDKLKLDEAMFAVYDKGGEIVITEGQHHDCDTLHAVKRY